MSKTIKSLPGVSKTRSVLVIASYREFESLRVLLRDLDKVLPHEVSIVVSDDTGADSEDKILEIVSSALAKERNWLISFENQKNGRGNAVHRGLILARKILPTAEYFIECDADGSHQPSDIEKIIISQPSDFLIGSRYMPASRISGWPRSRRITSKFLNFLIPQILGVISSDLTNGLRRYSIRATDILLKNKPINSGFIFLSEQALILSKNGIYANEIPIHFINRVHGKSSVGPLEIWDSLKGLFILYRAKKYL